MIDYVSCGDMHTLFLDGEGKIHSCGRNRNGALGVALDQNFNRKSYYKRSEKQVFQVKCKPFVKFVQISGGRWHSLAVTDDHKLYVFGWGYYGQTSMGKNSEIDVRTPKLVDINSEKIIYVACGDYHSIFVALSGNCYTSGYNKSFQLGIGNFRTNKKTPNLVKFKRNVKIVSAGASDRHSVFISTCGSAFSTGCCTSGALGLGSSGQTLVGTPQEISFPKSFQNSIVKCALGSSMSVFLSHSGCLLLCGSSNQSSKKFKTAFHYNKLPSKIVNIGCEKYSNVYAINTKGEVYDIADWENVPKVINFPVVGKRALSISGGEEFAVCVFENGQICGRGRNSNFQTSVKENQNKLSKDWCLSDYTLMIKKRKIMLGINLQRKLNKGSYVDVSILIKM